MAIFKHSITLGNKVYLYKLLTAEAGFGRQTYLPRIQEILEQDGIYPTDMGCETVLEVMEQMSEFVRVASFKGGRAYVTLSHVEKWDVELEKLERAAQKDASSGGAKGGRPWKRSKGTSSLRPQKPRHRTAKKKTAPTPEPLPEPEAKVEAAETSQTEAAPEEPQANQAPETLEKIASADEQLASDQDDKSDAPRESASDDKPAEDLELTVEAEAPVATEPEVENASEAISPDKAEDEATKAGEDEADHAPELPAEDSSHMRLTVTYDPYADMEDELAEREEGRATEAPDASTTDEPKEQRRSLPRDLPQSLSAEAQCPGKILVELASIVPLGDDPLTWLDNDWQRARAYGLIAGTRSNVTFPLTLRRLDGTGPATATLRKTRKASSTRLWQVSSVEIGAVQDGEVAGIEGTSRTSAGPWCALDVLASSEVDPLEPLAGMDEAAREAARSDLSACAAEGQWCASAPTEEVLAHVAIMLAKAKSQDVLCQEDGYSWFPIALAGAQGEPLEACLADGARIRFRERAADAPNVPSTGAARLLSLAEEGSVIASDETIEAIASMDYVKISSEAVAQALRLARNDWRRARCAWSPETNATYLLLPLAGSDVYASFREQDGSLTLTGALTCAHALACARTCSAD